MPASLAYADASGKLKTGTWGAKTTEWQMKSDVASAPSVIWRITRTALPSNIVFRYVAYKRLKESQRCHIYKPACRPNRFRKPVCHTCQTSDDKLDRDKAIIAGENKCQRKHSHVNVLPTVRPNKKRMSCTVLIAGASPSHVAYFSRLPFFAAARGRPLAPCYFGSGRILPSSIKVSPAMYRLSC